MRTLSCVIVFAASLLAQLATAPVNLNFESGETGKVPVGWGWGGSSTAAGASATLTDVGCYEGARCAMLKGADEPPANWFGTLTQGVDASAYLTRRIRFRAAVRVEGAETRAQMWLRVDRRTSGSSFFDNMSNRPITSADWAKCTIDGYVLDDSARIYFGPASRSLMVAALSDLIPAAEYQNGSSW